MFLIFKETCTELLVTGVPSQTTSSQISSTLEMHSIDGIALKETSCSESNTFKTSKEWTKCTNYTKLSFS